jgi:acid phosphatase
MPAVVSSAEPAFCSNAADIAPGHLELLDRLQNPDMNLTASLSFLKSWTYFTDPSVPAFENLTATGPYAGTLQAFNTGKILRERYDHLVSTTRPTRFWSCSSSRDVQTARYFADGFFGSQWSWDGSAELEIIPEDEDRGANTLTPGDTCLEYRTDISYGHDYGYGKLAEWQRVFTKPIADRVTHHAGGLKLSPLDIYSMMEMCGFEILARGSSSWCDVFTPEEWLHFEYARDVLHFYRAGPGNAYAGAMGWLWLNATQDLMSNHSSKDVYFSFVHDGDIVPVMSTLQLLNEQALLQELPTDRVKTDRRWKTSDVVPMGGRLVFERIACGTQSETAPKEHFVRLFINDGLMPLPGLPPGRDIKHAVRLADFHDFIASKGALFGDFREMCSLPDDAADRITFLHQ